MATNVTFHTFHISDTEKVILPVFDWKMLANPVLLAQSVGQALGYSDNGRDLRKSLIRWGESDPDFKHEVIVISSKITMDDFLRFNLLNKGPFLSMFEGKAHLEGIKKSINKSNGSFTLLTPLGVEMVVMKSQRPNGKAFRSFMATTLAASVQRDDTKVLSEEKKEAPPEQDLTKTKYPDIAPLPFYPHVDPRHIAVCPQPMKQEMPELIPPPAPPVPLIDRSLIKEISYLDTHMATREWMLNRAEGFLCQLQDAGLMTTRERLEKKSQLLHELLGINIPVPGSAAQKTPALPAGVSVTVTNLGDKDRIVVKKQVDPENEKGEFISHVLEEFNTKYGARLSRGAATRVAQVTGVHENAVFGFSVAIDVDGKHKRNAFKYNALGQAYLEKYFGEFNDLVLKEVQAGHHRKAADLLEDVQLKAKEDADLQALLHPKMVLSSIEKELKKKYLGGGTFFLATQTSRR